MRKTVVPARNLILTAIMAGVGKTHAAQAIALGVHSGDHYIYPDCRPEFTRGLNQLLMNSEQIAIYTPFEQMDKARILQVGFGLEPRITVPYEHTRTCYKEQAVACGKCGSCTERLEAWKAIGKEDPIDYEWRPSENE